MQCQFGPAPPCSAHSAAALLCLQICLPNLATWPVLLELRLAAGQVVTMRRVKYGLLWAHSHRARYTSLDMAGQILYSDLA